MAIDDGTGVMWVELKSLLVNNPSLKFAEGSYVMVIGPILGTATDIDSLQAHQVIPLDAKYQRETMWMLEVIEYWMVVVRPPVIEIE
jgi:hypothetical protein